MVGYEPTVARVNKKGVDIYGLKTGNKWNVGGGSGLRLADSLVKIGKWLDGEQWVTDKDDASEESKEVITRSRLWLWSWVGKCTCCIKLNDERRERNWEVAWSEWLSRWMLKSPAMTNSWCVVATWERRDKQKKVWRRWKMMEDDKYWIPISLTEVAWEWQKMTRRKRIQCVMG